MSSLNTIVAYDDGSRVKWRMRAEGSVLGSGSRCWIGGGVWVSKGLGRRFIVLGE